MKFQCWTNEALNMGKNEAAAHNRIDSGAIGEYCVIVPTYNNGRTLENVVSRISEFTDEILIVNDGCTDGSVEILKKLTRYRQIHFPENRGKGAALRAGFKEAIAIGYRYAITIDSDGQHYPEDIPKFLEAIESLPDSLLIGSRNMTHESVPKNSSFGNRFSNFWFWFETGVRLTDTQSGFRLYPLNEVKDLKLVTRKFEFEIEIIVKLSWAGVAVTNVPIRVLYDAEERVSHFRPYKDFIRISILNTWLVLVSLLYIRPRNLWRQVKTKGIRRFFLENVLVSSDPPLKKSFSVALGTFVGISPFWGFQTVLVLFLASVLRLNKGIAFAFSNISIPPMIPFLVYGSIQFGSLILNTNTKINTSELKLDKEALLLLKEYLVGSFALALTSGFLLGLISFVTLRLIQKRG